MVSRNKHNPVPISIEQRISQGNQECDGLTVLAQKFGIGIWVSGADSRDEISAHNAEGWRQDGWVLITISLNIADERFEERTIGQLILEITVQI